jgi:DNA-binding MarR family transcriptional regulator
MPKNGRRKASTRPIVDRRGASVRTEDSSIDGEILQQFIWDIVSISSSLEDIRRIWADTLGVSGPQWLILMAINELDRGAGVSLRDVTAKLHVDPSFIATQSRMLEKSGFVRRVASSDDARILLMTLTEKTSDGIKSLSALQETLNSFIFSDLDGQMLNETFRTLSFLKAKLEKAKLRLASEI